MKDHYGDAAPPLHLESRILLVKVAMHMWRAWPWSCNVHEPFLVLLISILATVGGSDRRAEAGEAS